MKPERELRKTKKRQLSGISNQQSMETRMARIILGSATRTERELKKT